MQLLLTLWMFIFPVFAANPNTPHAHTGIATSLRTLRKRHFPLQKQQLYRVVKPLLKQIQEGNGGRGVAIFDVSATPDQVWKVITSFENYPSYIDELSKVETYATKGNDLFVDFTISSWGFEVQCCIKHDYQPSKGYMTWTRLF